MAEAIKVSLPLKKFKKIPVYIVEEHNDALQFIYSAIGGKKLPLEGTTLLHLDAHPDMLIDRKLKGIEARSGRNLLPLLQIENWIVPATAAGHIGRVVWLRPPWAKQFTDGTRSINVGDHPTTGLLRVDSNEPYYLSDALYSSRLLNKKEFILTVAELNDMGKDDHINILAKDMNIVEPYVLDIDLDFFSTGNPFLSLYENINLYDRLERIFGFELPDLKDPQAVEVANEKREQQLQELETLFSNLEKHNSLENYKGEKTKLFDMVSEVSEAVIDEAAKLGQSPEWWEVFAGGCTRDQGGLPYHISTEEEITNMVTKALSKLLESLPPPVIITIARSTEDGYCPKHQVDFIQSLVIKTLEKIYDVDEPLRYYLIPNTS